MSFGCCVCVFVLYFGVLDWGSLVLCVALAVGFCSLQMYVCCTAAPGHPRVFCGTLAL